MLPEPFRAMDPDDDLGWHAVADWLEEHDSPRRAELVRLTRLLRDGPRVPDAERHQDRLRELLASGVEPCVATLTNSIGMEFVYVPAGVFLMGSPEDEEGHREAEEPMHEVEIRRGFWLGRYPLTQAEYKTVTGKNPSLFSGRGRGKGKDKVEGLDTRRFPVETVSHENAVSFCNKLSEKEKDVKCKYRLPTEVEWEYACRGGSKTPFHFGDTLPMGQANFAGNHSQGGVAKGEYLGRTCVVGSYAPNAFGLYDMHGNVAEWCAYCYDYGEGHDGDLGGPPTDISVLRGGSFNHVPLLCRAAYHRVCLTTFRSVWCGCRILLCLD